MNSNDIPDWLVDFLNNKVGISSRALRNANKSTRLYHDLGIYGDEGDWFIEAMDDAGVDMARFEYYKYFPPEHYGNNFVASMLYSCIPFLKLHRRRSEFYLPLTIAMIQRALESKRWLD